MQPVPILKGYLCRAELGTAETVRWAVSAHDAAALEAEEHFSTEPAVREVLPVWVKVLDTDSPHRPGSVWVKVETLVVKP